MPKDRLRFAAIGCLRRGWTDLSSIASHSQVDLVAACDIDQRHFANVDKGWPGTPHFTDFRRMFDAMADDIDAVSIATPDHTHAVIAQEALRRGKHVYCEKPLTHTVWEARQLTRLAEKAGVTTRMGNQIHSEYQYRATRAIIQDDKAIGKVKEVHTWIAAPGHGRSGALEPPTEPQSAPPEVDWESWIGPAPYREFGGPGLYHPFAWRDWQDFGSGSIGDNGCHLLDPLFTALDLKAPLSLMADHTGINDQVWPAQETIHYLFPGTHYTAGDTLEVTWYDGGRLPKLNLPGVPEADLLPTPGSLLVGEKGCLMVPHWGTPKLYPETDFADYILPDVGKRHHWHDWVDACLSGEPISDDFAYAGPLTEAVQLGNIAARFPGQRLKWDPVELRIPNLPEANAFLSKRYREGWEVAAVH